MRGGDEIATASRGILRAGRGRELNEEITNVFDVPVRNSTGVCIFVVNKNVLVSAVDGARVIWLVVVTRALARVRIS